MNEHGQRTFFPFVKKQLNERSKSYDNNSEERQSFEEDFVRIMRYLEDEVPVSIQGLAIFACSASEDWFEVGLFEKPTPDPALKAKFALPEYRQVSLDAARESMTLLKNGA